MLPNNEDSGVTPLTISGKRVRAIPEQWIKSFGTQFYLHDKTISELVAQSEPDWKLRSEGQLFETGKKLNVTDFEELRKYIKEQLKDLMA